MCVTFRTACQPRVIDIPRMQDIQCYGWHVVVTALAFPSACEPRREDAHWPSPPPAWHSCFVTPPVDGCLPLYYTHA